jgi:hypothetical protein
MSCNSALILNDDTVIDANGNTCSGGYGSTSDRCGTYDRAAFVANTMCSVCNGGLSDDDSVTDSRGAGYYCSTHYTIASDCGTTYDRDSFSASNRCCICGAGYRTNNDAITDNAITYDPITNTGGNTCTSYYDGNSGRCGTLDRPAFKAALLC